MKLGVPYSGKKMVMQIVTNQEINVISSTLGERFLEPTSPRRRTDWVVAMATANTHDLPMYIYVYMIESMQYKIIFLSICLSSTLEFYMLSALAPREERRRSTCCSQEGRWRRRPLTKEDVS
jgi:hypothetical protein